MPFTPFHFGPGAAFYALAPRHVSFLAFCAANVLIDIEPLYFLLTDQYPLHRFFHTYVGATVIFASTVFLFTLPQKSKYVTSVLHLLRWQFPSLQKVATGTALGSYSHIVLDSLMHPDIRPFAPMGDANPLFQAVSVSNLHWACLAAGVVGLLILGVRKVVREWTQSSLRRNEQQPRSPRVGS